MLHVFISNSISIRSNLSIHYYSAKFFLILLPFFLSSIQRCHSASISTLSNLSSVSVEQSEFMSQLSHQNFILRQYFIDLLNISHSSLVRSMSFDHHLQKMKSMSKKFDRRKRSMTENSNSSPLFTLPSSNCTLVNHQIQSTFHWSHSLTSLSSIELIYHTDSFPSQSSLIPVHLRWKQSDDLTLRFETTAQLEFDADRDFYFFDILPSFPRISTDDWIIEANFPGETCLTSQIYMIISSLSKNQSQVVPGQVSSSVNLRQLVQTKAMTSKSSACQLQSIQIQFEELGLAYLIIRPKEYLFTYCAGSCSSPSSYYPQSSSGTSIHALLQMMIQRNNPQIPQPTCVPSEYADDQFLLRQNDGTIEISPIKDIIVKQCACL